MPDDVKRAVFRAIGITLMVLGALLGASLCGDQYGRDHAAEGK